MFLYGFVFLHGTEKNGLAILLEREKKKRVLVNEQMKLSPMEDMRCTSLTFCGLLCSHIKALYTTDNGDHRTEPPVVCVLMVGTRGQNSACKILLIVVNVVTTLKSLGQRLILGWKRQGEVLFRGPEMSGEQQPAT